MKESNIDDGSPNNFKEKDKKMKSPKKHPISTKPHHLQTEKTLKSFDIVQKPNNKTVSKFSINNKLKYTLDERSASLESERDIESKGIRKKKSHSKSYIDKEGNPSKKN